MDKVLRSKLQLYLINSIKNLNNSVQNIYSLLKTIDYINSSSTDENINFQTDFKEYSKSQIRNEFNKSLYATCLSQILINFNPNLSKQDNSVFIAVKELFLKVISTAEFSESFDVIYELCFSLK